MLIVYIAITQFSLQCVLYFISPRVSLYGRVCYMQKYWFGYINTRLIKKSMFRIKFCFKSQSTNYSYSLSFLAHIKDSLSKTSDTKRLLHSLFQVIDKFCQPLNCII